MSAPQPLNDIANKLVECCQNNEEAKALDTLYAADAVSVEAADYTGQGREAAGLDAIRAKHEWWFGAHEVHSQNVDGPYLHGEDQFSVIFELDVTNKESQDRMQMKETATYTIKDGKIAREEFFYKLG